MATGYEARDNGGRVRDLTVDVYDQQANTNDGSDMYAVTFPFGVRMLARVREHSDVGGTVSRDVYMSIERSGASPALLIVEVNGNEHDYHIAKENEE